MREMWQYQREPRSCCWRGRDLRRCPPWPVSSVLTTPGEPPGQTQVDPGAAPLLSPRTGHVTNHVEGCRDLVMSHCGRARPQVKWRIPSWWAKMPCSPEQHRTDSERSTHYETRGLKKKTKLFYGLWTHTTYYKTMTYRSGMMLIPA